MRRDAGLLAAVAAVVLVAPASSRAQAAPATLDQVEELTRMGRTDDARTTLLSWWSASYAKARRRDVQRALWLRGQLTVDPAQAELDYRRLVVEFPGGPFSDQALLRLAQSAFAQGDSATAAQNVLRIEREYPGGAAAREATAWLAAAGPAPHPVGVAAAVPPAPPDSVASAPRDTATAPAPEPTAEAPGPVSTGRTEAKPHFTVQLGAFASRARAEALLDRARAAGFDARLALVPGSDLVRVRVGTFGVERDATAILRQLTERGFTAAVARDAHMEERAGR